MVLAVLNILVGLLLGIGAVQQLVVLGPVDRRVQLFFVGLAGMVVSVFFILSGVAIWRKWPGARRLVIVAATLSILFHVYAILPPHRYVGPPALIIGVGYSLVILIITFSSKGKKPEPVIS
ncbi:MAG TPA: hypothetical protein VGN86_09730 [Pyrinomonadaceae bacterium]|jgi:hypothetical protein|nr:hypothetical protein [Pyrinomonadaceae bacterium]